MLRAPAVIEVSEQLPDPATSVAVQVAPAPSSIATEPAGVPAVDVTVTATLSDDPMVDGSGAWLVIVVTVAAGEKMCDAVAELARNGAAPA